MSVLIKIYSAFPLAFLLILLEKNVKVCGSVCSISTKNGLQTASCEDKELRAVPTDLPSSIEAIDISFNPIESMDGDSFKSYSNLKSIRATSLKTKKTRVNRNTFRDLEKLKELDLSATNLGDFPHLDLPTNLQVYKIDKTNFQELELTTQKELTELSATGNQIKEFPDIHKLAPIKTIDLKRNPIDYVRAESIASFCLLTYLGLDIKEGAKMLQPESGCECYKFKLWITKYGIKGVNNFNCNPESIRNCDPEFSEQMLKEYDVCAKRFFIDWMDVLKSLGLFLIAFLIGGSIFSFILYAYTTINDTSGLPPRKKKTSIVEKDPTTGTSKKTDEFLNSDLEHHDNEE